MRTWAGTHGERDRCQLDHVHESDKCQLEHVHASDKYQLEHGVNCRQVKLSHRAAASGGRTRSQASAESIAESRRSKSLPETAATCASVCPQGQRPVWGVTRPALP
jgi:hypothetical protein